MLNDKEGSEQMGGEIHLSSSSTLFRLKVDEQRVDEEALLAGFFVF